MNLVSCIAASIMLLSIAQASAKDALPDLVGRIVGVHDGDSITLLTSLFAKRYRPERHLR